MAGECWDRFARKTLLTFTGYIEREPPIVSELERIGMKGVHVQWQFPNPFESVLLDNLKHERCLSVGYMNATMGHYRAIKTAYHLGLENCLVIEDDIRFLKDVSEIDRMVSSLPDDFDVAMFDVILLGIGDDGIKNYINAKKGRKVNDSWSEFDRLRSQGCYALSRRAMKRYIWLNEASVTDPKIGKLRIGDHFMDRKYMGNDMKMYFPSKHIAIQRAIGKTNTNMKDMYDGMDVEKSMYAE